MKILATIVLVIAMLGSAALVIKCMREGGEMAKIENMPGAGLLKSFGDLPSAGRLKMGGYVNILLAAASIFGIVAAFGKTKKIGLAGAAAVGLAAILMIIITPDLPGIRGGAGLKTIAIIVGVIAIAGAGLVYLVSSKRAE